MRKLRSLGLFGALAVLAAGLTFAGAPRAQAASGAFVRVAHAAPAAPDVDAYVDGNKLLSDFKFGTVTDYMPLAAGSHQIEVTPAGQPASAAR